MRMVQNTWSLHPWLLLFSFFTNFLEIIPNQPQNLPNFNKNLRKSLEHSLAYKKSKNDRGGGGTW